METQTCTQHGCPYDADEPAEVCPVCNNPQADVDVDDDVPWTDYTIGELRDQAEDWELDGWTSRTSKADLIALLEAAEAE